MQTTSTYQTRPLARRGFTLLELLVVVGILAIVGTSMIVAYDGLTENAAQSQATHSIGALDGSIRTFKALNGAFPDEGDSLLVNDNNTFKGLDSLSTKLYGKLGTYTLTAGDVSALNAAGITRVRDVSVVEGYPLGDNDVPAEVSIPNRVFDNKTRGWGVERVLQANGTVAAVESAGQNTSINDFNGKSPGDSSRLRDIAGLDEGFRHLVVAFGVGNNSTLINKFGKFENGAAKKGGLSEAPTYANVAPNRYARYLALYYVATDTNDDGDFDDTGERAGRAELVALIDSKGDWLDEEYAEAIDQKK